jgi:glycosyltransferase involved in cell wall biosynthesis
MKADVVMWAKNGAKYLPLVLKRIEKVIPQNVINQKIMVDDSSIDETPEIAKKYGWMVYKNPQGGIPSGANEALSHVTAPFFISVEQDVLLARDWWSKISKHMENPKVAVVQGLRIYTHPVLKCLDEYALSKVKDFTHGYSLDNNLFRTEAIRELGGFPNKCPFCTDAYIRHRVDDSPYLWIVDETVISQHIRTGLRYELKHYGNAIVKCRCKKYDGYGAIVNHGKIFLTSPLRAIQVAVQKRCPNIIWFYPLYRFQIVKSIILRRKLNRIR